MPKEVRRIIVTNDELKEIVHKLVCDRSTVSAVLDVEISTREPVTVYAVLHNSNGKQSRMAIHQDALLNTMVTYCKQAGIPIPRSARKGVHAVDKCLAFDMVLNEYAIGEL